MAKKHKAAPHPPADTPQEVGPKDTYRTVAAAGEGLYKEKGSKFLGFVYEVTSEEQVKEKLDALRKQFFDARHHCYAFVLGLEGKHFRASDDGEPGHSAGDPILGQIRSHNLTDTLVVVVRYFGGTKLGVSGLIHAYRTAAAEAITQAGITERIVMATLTVHFDYLAMNEVMKLTKKHDLEVVNQEFDNNCRLTVKVRLAEKAQVLAVLEDIEGVADVEEQGV